MPTQKKIETVDNLKKSFEKASAYIFVDYRGLTVSALTELRAALWKFGATLSVAKNTLVEKAVNIKNDGPTAILFAKDNPVASLKTLVEFAKNNPVLKVKNGSLDGKNFTGEEMVTIAGLPSREILLSKLAGGLISPVQRLITALSGNPRKLVIVLSKIAKGKQA